MATNTSKATSSLLLNHNNNHFLFSLSSKKPSLFHPFPSFSSKNTPLPSLSFSSSFSSPSTSSSSGVTRVTTAPLEYAPPAPDSNNFQQEISRLKTLRLKLSASKTLKQKLRVLNSDSRVKHFLNTRGFERVLGSLGLGLNASFLIKCLIAAGQEHVLDMGFGFVEGEGDGARSSVKAALYALVGMIEKWDGTNGGAGGREGFLNGVNGSVLEDEESEDLKKLLMTLEEMEEFYDCIGGIIGYQIMVLELLGQSSLEMQTTNHSQRVHESMECQFLEIHSPTGCDLSQDTEYASQAALWGIEGLPDLGEIYPLGGSADRLGLVDSDTGECLPAAMLPYCGRTLLEGLIRDLQAREFLYFKLYGKQCITPVAIMTSSAKNNHEHITSLCERLGWFGRGRSSFQLFEQPLVPTISAEDGQWLVRRPFVPVCKPGGHGVI